MLPCHRECTLGVISHPIMSSCKPGCACKLMNAMLMNAKLCHAHECRAVHAYEGGATWHEDVAQYAYEAKCMHMELTWYEDVAQEIVLLCGPDARQRCRTYAWWACG